MEAKREQDFNEKLSALRGILKARNADVLLLDAQNHFSWLTGGRGFIGVASVAACATLVVRCDAVYLVVENIEAGRLYKEQLSDNPAIEVLEYPWHLPAERAKLIQRLTCNKNVLTEAMVSEELFATRTVMTEYDTARYRKICAETAHALEDVCRTLTVGMTEYELAGRLAERFWANNLEPITLLIGFDERALSYRHPVPVGAVLKNYALIAVCTRRCGLIASATRLVALTRDEEMMRRQKVSGYVDAVLCAATMPGADTADVMATAIRAYAEQGYDGEWKFHHQGGLTGYLPREMKGMTEVHHKVRVGEAYGWNPSVQGAKSENTILVTKTGCETLTHTGNYPYLAFDIAGKKILTEDILVLDEQ